MRTQRELAERGLTDPPLDELATLNERSTRDLDAWARTVRALEAYVSGAPGWPDYTFTIDIDGP